MLKKDNMISELLDGLDTIRPTLLADDKRSAEHRSLLSRMLSLLETLQRTPSIDPSLYKKVLAMLAVLFDAEHGALVKRMHDAEANNDSWETFESHVTERRVLIDAAQQDLPTTLAMLRRGFDLLGKPKPEDHNLSAHTSLFERYLREHLLGNAKVKGEFNLLTSALKESMHVMGDMLDEVGEASPELQHVQDILEKDLPSDPKEALAMLREARNDILTAGQKLTDVSQQVKETMATQVEQMNQLSKRLEHAEAQARNDPLTGLANRRKLREFFGELAEDIVSTFLMIDIDHFKHINDQYGHDAGDDVLSKLGKLLKVAVRSTDMVARLGGEEFCIILPETKAAQGIALAEKIRTEVEAEHFDTKQGNIDVKVSIGVSERLPNEPINDWLKRADKALYQAKNNGRNQVVTAAVDE
ncbi:MAG: GGDEF domain-containing protein [Ghiorsea sp.]